jgi:hypothetical protein
MFGSDSPAAATDQNVHSARRFEYGCYVENPIAVEIPNREGVRGGRSADDEVAAGLELGNCMRTDGKQQRNCGH